MVAGDPPDRKCSDTYPRSCSFAFDTYGFFCVFVGFRATYYVDFAVKQIGFQLRMPGDRGSSVLDKV